MFLEFLAKPVFKNIEEAALLNENKILPRENFFAQIYKANQKKLQIKKMIFINKEVN